MVLRHCRRIARAAQQGRCRQQAHPNRPPTIRSTARGNQAPTRFNPQIAQTVHVCNSFTPIPQSFRPCLARMSPLVGCFGSRDDGFIGSSEHELHSTLCMTLASLWNPNQREGEKPLQPNDHQRLGAFALPGAKPTAAAAPRVGSARGVAASLGSSRSASRTSCSVTQR